MPRVAVVILNWNGKNFLEQFLPSVIAHSITQNSSVYIIDNNSSDDSIRFLKEKYPTLPIIELSKNFGFAEGYNLGLQQISADYYVLLNSDVEVTSGWIEPVISFMQEHTEVAVCMPKIKSFVNKHMFEYAGAAGGFIDKYGFPFCQGRLFTSIEQDDGQYNTPRSIFWSSGAAMFVKSSVYHELGGLDKDFFAHMEEIDFCWRAKNKGYQVYYIPSSQVFHVGGGTLPQSSPFKTYLNFRNSLYVLYKNLPNKHFRRTLFIRKIFDGIAFLMFLCTGKVGEANAVLKAHIDYYKHLSQLRFKRKELLQNEQYSHHPEIYKKSIVIEYFLRKRKKILL